jgi:RNA polymerase sigma-70 factor, ECF subfamily
MDRKLRSSLIKTTFSNWTTLSSAVWLVFRRVALRFLGNIADAEDAVQDAFLSAFTHLDQFGGQAKMSTWLTAIVSNAARMKLRQRRPQTQISLDEAHGGQNLPLAEMVPDQQPNPEELCCRRELAGRLADATTQLPPTLRRTFQLRDLSSECQAVR